MPHTTYGGTDDFAQPPPGAADTTGMLSRRALLAILVLIEEVPITPEALELERLVLALLVTAR